MLQAATVAFPDMRPVRGGAAQRDGGTVGAEPASVACAALVLVAGLLLLAMLSGCDAIGRSVGRSRTATDTLRGVLLTAVGAVAVAYRLVGMPILEMGGAFLRYLFYWSWFASWLHRVMAQGCIVYSVLPPLLFIACPFGLERFATPAVAQAAGIDTAAADVVEDEDGSGATLAAAEDDAPSSGWPDWALALIGPQRGEPAVAVAWALLVIFFCALAHASVRLDSPWRRKHRLSPFLAIVLLTAAAAGFALDGWSCAAIADAIGYPVGTAAFAYVCEACGALLLALAIVGPPAPPGGFADARHVGASGGFVGSRGSRSSGRYAASGWSDGSGFPAEHAPSGAPDSDRAGRTARSSSGSTTGAQGAAAAGAPCSGAARASAARPRSSRRSTRKTCRLRECSDFRANNDYLRRDPDALARAALARGFALVAAVGACGGFFFLPTAMVS